MMRTSMICSVLALSILAGCSGTDSQDPTASDSEDAVSTTFVHGSWVAEGNSVDAISAIDFRPDHSFFLDENKFFNHGVISGSPIGYGRSTGTWHVSTKNKTITLDYDHGELVNSPGFSVVYDYTYTAPKILNGMYLPGSEPMGKLSLTQPRPTNGSQIAYPTQKFEQVDSYCTSNDDCKTEVEDGTSNDGTDKCNTKTNACK